MQNSTVNSGQTKNACPFCGGEITLGAQKCQHCGEWLNKPIKVRTFKKTVLFAFFLGVFGVHRFYTGYIGIGILQLLTFGGLGIWALIDVFSICLNKYMDADKKPLKDYDKTTAIIIGILALLLLFYNCRNFIDGYNNTETVSSNTNTTTSSAVSDVKTTSNTTKPRLEILEHHPCTGDFGEKMVCGTVINNTTRTIGYAQVEINLYDTDMSLVDSTLDNINNLEPGSKWKFKAPILDDNVNSYKIKDVSGF